MALPSATAFEVRPARAADLEFLVRANAALAEESEGLALDRERLRAGVAAALSDAHRGVYWIAEERSQPKGALLITREWSDWRNGWVWWIQSVYVDPRARGRGCYRALHAAVLASARAAGDVVGLRLYVERNNLRAQSVYRREGMQPSHYLLFEAADVLRSGSATPHRA
jgi:GNAT superfamily N-acetyltransferase